MIVLSCPWVMTLEDDAIMALAEESLPKDWRADPPPSSTMAIGDEWLAGNESLARVVPSTVVPQQFNLIINPNFADFGELEKSLSAEPFVFDDRLV